MNDGGTESSPAAPPSDLPGRASAYHIFRYREFRLFLAMRVFSNMAQLIQSVAVGWQVYDITRRPLDLGLVGLALFLPQVIFALPAGQAADRFPRQRTVLVSLGVDALASGLLLALTATGYRHVEGILAVLLLFGVGRAFAGPSIQAILPTVVPRADLPNAVTWNSSTWQAAVVVGPALGGLLYGLGPIVVYVVVLVLMLVAMAATALLRLPPLKLAEGRGSVAELMAGIRFVRENPILLGAVSLDLFAVLFGGATALLPVFARDILAVGPVGLGLLRSAPAVGSILSALWLASHPLRRHAGRRMFVAVAGFGAATIVFGLSHNMILSLAALAVAGACDMVSVYVRQTLVQLGTPDAMRGRVNAVSLVFIGASNELGEFESGFTAAWFGTVPAVILGGVGTLIVVGLWAWRFVELRQVDQLDRHYAESEN
jgi:MFS family permease